MKPKESKTIQALSHFLPILLGHTFSIFKSSNHRIPEADIRKEPPMNYVVYATYSENGDLRNDEIHFLNDVITTGRTCVLVNNGHKLSPLSLKEKVLIINRENKGRDLGAFRKAISSSIDFSGDVVFTNSSIIWSPNSFNKILSEKKDADVMFLTESLQSYRHGQSFFVYFSRSAITRNAHYIAFGSVRNWTVKRLLVWLEELPILNRLIEEGFTVNFFYSYDRILSDFETSKVRDDFLSVSDRDDLEKRVGMGIPLNPSIHFAGLIYKKYGIYKKSLRLNPAQMRSPLHFLHDSEVIEGQN